METEWFGALLRSVWFALEAFKALTQRRFVRPAAFKTKTKKGRNQQ
jgi:hypothetical protein